MGAGLLGRDLGQCSRISLPERTAGGRQQDVVDALGPGPTILGQALEDRRVLAVDRQQGRAAFLHRAQEQLAADHQRLLVGEQQPLAGPRRRQARTQPGGTDDGRDPAVARLEIEREVTVQPGTPIAFLPDDLHSIHVIGDEPTLHFHLYGRPLETLSQRIGVNLETGAVVNYNATQLKPSKAVA